MKFKPFIFMLVFCLIGFPLWGQNGYEGVSDPKNSEAEALLDARNNAYRVIAASFSSFIGGTWKIIQATRGTNLDDVALSIMGEANVTIRVHLTGIEEIENKVEKTNNGYIARVLITITEEGRRKAERYVDQEVAAYRAHNYFAGKFNFSSAALSNTPAGYPDFSSWLEGECLVFEMKEGGVDFLIQFDNLLQKLDRKIIVFPMNISGKPVRIIYNNSPDYFNNIANVLQRMNIRVFRENGRVLLAPAISPGEFRNRIQQMPDARLLTVTGISISNRQFTHISSTVLNEIARIAGVNGMQPQIIRIPEQYLNRTSYREAINTLDRNARYTVFLMSEASSGPSIAHFGISPYNMVFYRFILHDSITGKSVYSDKAIGGVSFSGYEAYGRLPSEFIQIIRNLLKNL
ncbi:MAG: hypothetical protein FWD26_07865 [Treponema sp.]|nr:hypothetical protein [Treponema sp.]